MVISTLTGLISLLFLVGYVVLPKHKGIHVDDGILLHLVYKGKKYRPVKEMREPCPDCGKPAWWMFSCPMSPCHFEEEGPRE